MSKRIRSYLLDKKIFIEADYTDNIYDGVYNEYYPSGSLHITAIYKKGKLHTDYIEYNIDGSLKERRLYLNGERVI